MTKSSKLQFPSILKSNLLLPLILLLLIAASVYKTNADDTYVKKLKSEILPDTIKKVMNNQNAKITINNLKEVSGLYEFDFKVETTGNPMNYTSYMTKDGKIVMPYGVKLSDLNKNVNGSQASNEEQKKLTCNDLSKTDKPKLTAFVVSQCPYGLQMQRVYKVAIDEQPDLLQYLDIKYIGSVENGKVIAMHGEKEAEENLRQICIREEQKNKYWDYVGCYMKEGKTEQCLSSTGINTSQLNSCMNDKNKGIKYAQADFDIATKLGASGSPTLFLNGKQKVSEFDFGGRVADALRQIISCASNNPSDTLKKEISKDQIPPSFSTSDTQASGEGSTASSGSTGTGCESAQPSQ